MNRTRIQIAKPDILAFFDRQVPPVFKARQIAAALSQERGGWRLAQSTTVDDFVAFLKKSGKLKTYTFEFPHRAETIYVWGDVPSMEMFLHLKVKSYYSHYTAMRLHGLTEQVPKVLYISHERSAGVTGNSSLSQVNIDEAFQRPVRVSNNAVDFQDQRVMLLNSAFTNELGVIDIDAQLGADSGVKVRVTNLERTLIDAVVRPAYCGGVFEVAKAFELAKDVVSVNAMGALLHKLHYAYPYHQAIGFYLERAGYRSRSLELMRHPMPFDFYLTHDMGETRYVPTWKLHVPKGF
jgi:hypothetical protein